eukprot:TRINITY_DN2877_c0_g1_i2.p1 TRINITY_DN2877_c0_g1~~TRINITY_DN2877_c0_g1_i2.p1  ORF type:complete len:464 (-),score=125.16 TRINITY_DN2877_c0_g1_i2:2030-3421(-)
MATKHATCFNPGDTDEGDESENEELSGADDASLDIGEPMEVQHLAHVTFDRFKGFMGLPLDMEQQVPGRAPSAGRSVFGVNPDSMQCTYDDQGNSVPTILLLLQARLYNQGGLQAEGIFRVAAGTEHEEHVRSQLDSGVVPTNMDVHALAGLIKAWFRELPEGLLNGLSHDALTKAVDSESDAAVVQLVKELPAAQQNLVEWTVNLMVDVVEFQQQNLMNAQSIATVFAPNMFQVTDPITALLHAAKVMKLLKILVLAKQRERHAEGEAGAEASVAGDGDEGFSTPPYQKDEEGADQKQEEGGGTITPPIPEKPSERRTATPPIIASTHASPRLLFMGGAPPPLQEELLPRGFVREGAADEVLKLYPNGAASRTDGVAAAAGAGMSSINGDERRRSGGGGSSQDGGRIPPHPGAPSDSSKKSGVPQGGGAGSQDRSAGKGRPEDADDDFEDAKEGLDPASPNP